MLYLTYHRSRELFQARNIHLFNVIPVTVTSLRSLDGSGGREGATIESKTVHLFSNICAGYRKTKTIAWRVRRNGRGNRRGFWDVNSAYFFLFTCRCLDTLKTGICSIRSLLTHGTCRFCAVQSISLPVFSSWKTCVALIVIRLTYLVSFELFVNPLGLRRVLFVFRECFVFDDGQLSRPGAGLVNAMPRMHRMLERIRFVFVTFLPFFAYLAIKRWIIFVHTWSRQFDEANLFKILLIGI